MDIVGAAQGGRNEVIDFVGLGGRTRQTIFLEHLFLQRYGDDLVIGPRLGADVLAAFEESGAGGQAGIWNRDGYSREGFLGAESGAGQHEAQNQQTTGGYGQVPCPARAEKTRRGRGNLRQAGFQQRTGASGGWGASGEFLLLDAYKIGDGVFQFPRAGAAFPAGFQVLAGDFLFVRRQFAFEIQEQVSVRKMIHEFHRSVERAMRARDRVKERETAPRDMSRIPAISR